MFGFLFVTFRQPKYFLAIVLSVLCVILLWISIKKNGYRPYFGNIIKNKWPVIVITFFLILITFVLYRSDADDSFYVSNVTLFQNSSVLNEYDSSFGNEMLGTVPMYDFQIWESLIAILSNVFHLEGVSMMHTYLIPVLLIASASAYLFLGEIIFEGDQRKGCMFYILLTLFHMFGGYAVYSEGSFLLSRIWQGKAVYLTVVLPVMIGFMLKYVNTNDSVLFLKLAVCVLAGMSLNPTSLYVIGFQLIFMMVAISIVKKDAKTMLHAVPSIIIAAMFTLLIYIRTSQYNGQIEASSTASKTFVIDTFKQFWGSGYVYVMLYFLACIIIWKKGNLHIKVYVLYTPLIMLFTIWNPVIGRMIAENVTKVPSYWRVFWLVPAAPAIIYVVIIMIDHYKDKRFKRAVAVCLGILIVAIPGTWMFSKDNGFVIAENVEKLPSEVITFGEDIISENDSAVVLGCNDFASTIRQKYTEVELVYSRYQYVLDLFEYRGMHEEASDRILLMNFSNGDVEDYSNIDMLLMQYEVDYIILGAEQENERVYLLSTNHWKIKEESTRYVLLQKEG